MMYVRDGQVFDIYQDHSIDEIFYPRGWFYNEDDRVAAGVSVLVEVDPPAIMNTQKLVLNLVEDGTQWKQHWSIVSKSAEELATEATELAALKKTLMASIDDHVAAVLQKSTRFSQGYVEREAAAASYKAGGYVGSASEWVARFARNTGMTDHQATDLILTQATGLRAALAELENLRMDKYLVSATATKELATAKFNAIMAQINAVVIP